MNYAVMPLSDYDAACDKVREKVDDKVVLFENKGFGYLVSEPFLVEAGKTYTLNAEFSDNSLYSSFVITGVGWKGDTSPWIAETTLPYTFTGYDFLGCCVYFSTDIGLTTNDIISASIECDGEIIADFVVPPKIKSGELAEKVDEVYNAGASDFGLKGKGQGELVHFENVHPIEHKIEVGLSSKNLFNDAEANITKTEDYFKSNVSYWQSPCLTIPVESGATYTCSCEYYTPNVTTFNTYLAYSISTEKTYTSANKALAMRLKTQSSAEGYSKVSDTFTVPEGIEEVYFIADNEGVGTYFKNFQIEKGTTPTTYAPFVADFSDCKVRTTGKNLLNLEGRTVVNFGGWGDKKRIFPEGKGIILALSGSNYYSGANATDHIYSVGNGNISYDQKSDWYGIGLDLPLTPNMTYKFSYGAMTGGFSLMEFDAEGNYLGQQYFSPTVKTKANTAWGVLLFSDMASVDISVTNPQLEVGSTFTAFEPYIGAEYTAAADGTVEGVKSISPVMNLMADKAGAVIDAECFLDPQAVITDLTNTVITLGGEV